MAWPRPLSEPMMLSWLTHICVTRPQSVSFNMMNQGVLGNIPCACWRHLMAVYFLTTKIRKRSTILPECIDLPLVIGHINFEYHDRSQTKQPNAICTNTLRVTALFGIAHGIMSTAVLEKPWKKSVVRHRRRVTHICISKLDHHCSTLLVAKTLSEPIVACCEIKAKKHITLNFY